ILPIGLTSLFQTFSISREAERTAELALLGRTATAAAGERALLQSAFGTADALGPAVLETRERGSVRNCMDMMTNFVERSSIYIYGGFTDLSGESVCNSSGDPQNVAETQGHKLFMARPGTHIYATSYDPITGQSVVTILQPVYSEA